MFLGKFQLKRKVLMIKDTCFGLFLNMIQVYHFPFFKSIIRGVIAVWNLNMFCIYFESLVYKGIIYW